MTTKQNFLTKMTTHKLTMCLLVVITMSACSTLPPQTKNQYIERDDEIFNREAEVDCREHAQSIANHAELIASSAQYLAAAKAMSSCVSRALQTRTYNHNDKQDDLIMKMMATATLNFIKSGDVITASLEVERFKHSYPNRDL
jgi:hypothetical protein